jgi:UDP-glucose 4-epimerase
LVPKSPIFGEDVENTDQALLDGQTVKGVRRLSAELCNRGVLGVGDRRELDTKTCYRAGEGVGTLTSPLPDSWLITGGAGFIGCNLIKRLLSEGVSQICVLDNLSVGVRGNLARVSSFTEVNPGKTPMAGLLPGRPPNLPRVGLFVADVRDAEACFQAAREKKVIVHLAANTGVASSVADPRQDLESNVLGTFNMLEAARNNRHARFIFASSGAPIGECKPPIHEELAPHPVSPYGASKLAGEGYCSAYHRTFGTATLCLRFGNVYGPLSSHKSSVIAKFIRQTLAGEVCEIYGDGNQTRDFIYIDDLIDAIIAAARVQSSPEYDAATRADPTAGEIFQIASNKEHTVNEVVEILRCQFQHRTGRTMLTKNMHPRIGDVRRNVSDTSKALRLLNWEANVQLDQGINRTLDWFLQERN